jgi:hypothetical protein
MLSFHKNRYACLRNNSHLLCLFISLNLFSTEPIFNAPASEPIFNQVGQSISQMKFLKRRSLGLAILVLKSAAPRSLPHSSYE